MYMAFVATEYFCSCWTPSASCVSAEIQRELIFALGGTACPLILPQLKNHSENASADVEQI